jgi:hypothetical protein
MTHAFFSDHSSPHFDKYHFNMTNVLVREQALEGSVRPCEHLGNIPHIRRLF